MKKTSRAKRHRNGSGEMCSEYRLDYRKARPNRFAGRLEQDRLVVVLDPDISKVFTTADSVNSVLRALIVTMPTSTNPKITHSSSRRSISK